VIILTFESPTAPRSQRQTQVSHLSGLTLPFVLDFSIFCSGQQDDKNSGVEASLARVAEPGRAAGFVPDFRLKPRLHLCNIILTTTHFEAMKVPGT
jgi:hypothetical protein